MVEGPGCTLNGEKIRSRVSKGQKVKDVRGSLTTATVSYDVSQYQASVSINLCCCFVLTRLICLYRKTTPRETPFTVFMVVSTQVLRLWGRNFSCTLVGEH